MTLKYGGTGQMGRISVCIIWVALQLFFCNISLASDSLSVLFWNLENFYDYVDEGKNIGEKEFSCTGSRHWTSSRFYNKCNAIAKSIIGIGDAYSSRLPEVVGFAEVENRGVISRLLSSTILYKADYKIVHYDSSDKRGSDVALIYRETVFEFKSSSAFKIRDSSGRIIPTRDILLVDLKSRKSGNIYHFIVNHHPSKFGGSRRTSQSRQRALEQLKCICDSLSGNGDIIVMGDFNESASNDSFTILESSLLNLALPLASKGRGTIRFHGKWDLIDMFFISPNLKNRVKMHIIEFEPLMIQDKTHTGYKPFRTYSGPRYTGGVSDHCPIMLEIY